MDDERTWSRAAVVTVLVLAATVGQLLVATVAGGELPQSEGKDTLGDEALGTLGAALAGLLLGARQRADSVDG